MRRDCALVHQPPKRPFGDSRLALPVTKRGERDDEVGSPPSLHYRLRQFREGNAKEGCSGMSGERLERRDLAGGVLHVYVTAT